MLRVEPLILLFLLYLLDCKLHSQLIALDMICLPTIEKENKERKKSWYNCSY